MLPAAGQIGQEIAVLTETSQTPTNIPLSFSHVWNLAGGTKS